MPLNLDELSEIGRNLDYQEILSEVVKLVVLAVVISAKRLINPNRAAGLFGRSRLVVCGRIVRLVVSRFSLEATFWCPTEAALRSNVREHPLGMARLGKFQGGLSPFSRTIGTADPLCAEWIASKSGVSRWQRLPPIKCIIIAAGRIG